MDAERFDTLVAGMFAPSRRAALRVLAGIGLAGLLDQADAKKKKRKKKCAKAGQKTSKKRKKCCKGLVKDVTKRCVPRRCTPGSCPANEICLRSGVCQPCTVTCTGTPAECGAALQTAMDGGGTVYVCPGRYQGGFTLSPPLATLSVIGAGEGTDAASDTILDANDLGRVLDINTGVGTVELERLRLTDGNTTTGAGINHSGTTLRMTECTVSGNLSVDGVGGGIASGGTLEMTRCTVRDNTASEGGGIYTYGTTILTDCLVEDNRATFKGGGLYFSDGTATLAGSTQVHDNAAEFGGGIWIESAMLEIAETCRVTENTAPTGQGGGIYNLAGTVTLQGADPSPIVVNNCHENCVGNVLKCAETPVSCPP